MFWSYGDHCVAGATTLHYRQLTAQPNIPSCCVMTIALRRPLPLTADTIDLSSFSNSFLSTRPSRAAFSARPSSSITWQTDRQTETDGTDRQTDKQTDGQTWVESTLHMTYYIPADRTRKNGHTDLQTGYGYFTSERVSTISRSMLHAWRREGGRERDVRWHQYNTTLKSCKMSRVQVWYKSLEWL